MMLEDDPNQLDLGQSNESGFVLQDEPLQFYRQIVQYCLVGTRAVSHVSVEVTRSPPSLHHNLNAYRTVTKSLESEEEIVDMSSVFAATSHPRISRGRNKRLAAPAVCESQVV